MDKTINNCGKTLLNLCSGLNIHLTNGRSGSDLVIGDYTYIGHNGASVIDYIICSPERFG